MLKNNKKEKSEVTGAHIIHGKKKRKMDKAPTITLDEEESDEKLLSMANKASNETYLTLPVVQEKKIGETYEVEDT